MSLVYKGLSYIEERSCLVFLEHNPEDLARKQNFTYLYYNYSEVLEDCCLTFFTKSVSRRVRPFIDIKCTMNSTFSYIPNRLDNIILTKICIPGNKLE